MARLPRYVLPGQPQHVIQRGNNKGIIFQGEGDYFYYLEKLQQSSEEHGCLIHAYVLMTNHVHLLVTPLEENSISKMQQMLGRYYVQYFNHRYCRTGTLWEGRYKATLIDSEAYLFTCMRYIEMNAVRAGMVSSPADYRWSSYHYNACGGEHLLISPHAEYISLGKTNEIRQQVYQDLCNARMPKSTLKEIRDATNNAWVLGTPAFKKKFEHDLNRPLGPAAKGGDHRSKQYRDKTETNRV